MAAACTRTICARWARGIRCGSGLLGEARRNQALRDLRREINEAYRAQIAARRCARQSKAAGKLPDIRYAPFAASGERSLVVCVADCHYGAEWTIRGLRDEVINAYSPEIFEARMAGLLSQLRHILEKEQTSHVALLLCGDALDGMLRASQLMRLRWGAVESCMRFAEYMADGSVRWRCMQTSKSTAWMATIRRSGRWAAARGI